MCVHVHFVRRKKHGRKYYVNCSNSCAAACALRYVIHLHDKTAVHNAECTSHTVECVSKALSYEIVRANDIYLRIICNYPP